MGWLVKCLAFENPSLIVKPQQLISEETSKVGSPKKNSDACYLQHPYTAIYSNRPAARPTAARKVAALPLYFMALFVVEALGALLEGVLEEPAVLEEFEELLGLLDIAAFWKASKLFAAVGLTAKTIPF